MDNVNQFTDVITYSHKANDLERAMASVFQGIVSDSLGDQLDELYNYGIPWKGSRTVVERFTKLNGLAVLRREDEGLSDKLMAIIYQNWTALASERGVAFLQFVLDMLYPKQNEIVRLWHPKSQAASYPLYVKEKQEAGDFLTSRLRIKISMAVDMAEISELAPILTRLVPWQVVPEIAVSIESEPIGLKVATVVQGYHVANFSPY